MMHPNFAGALSNSALYLLCVFVAGLVTAHPVAWHMAIAAMGFAYLSHLAALDATIAWTVNWIVWLSIVTGLFAGLALLV